MKPIRSLLGLATVLALSAHSHAHFLWLYAEPHESARLEVAERPGQEIAPILGSRLAELRAFNLVKLAEEAGKKGVKAAVKPGGGSDAVGANLVYGVHGDFLVDWSAKAILQISGAGEALGLPAEILLRHAASGLEAVVLRGGKPAANAEVLLWAPGAKEARALKTDRDGVAALDLDHGSIQPGLLAVAAIVTVPGGGKFKGTEYKEKRFFATVTFRVGTGVAERREPVPPQRQVGQRDARGMNAGIPLSW